jgi:hypothetical protein
LAGFSVQLKVKGGTRLKALLRMSFDGTAEAVP